MALLTSAVLALEYFATTSACEEGLCCVRIDELVIYHKLAHHLISSQLLIRHVHAALLLPVGHQ